MRWEWLTGRVEQRQEEWTNTETEGQEGNRGNGAVTEPPPQGTAPDVPKTKSKPSRVGGGGLVEGQMNL